MRLEKKIITGSARKAKFINATWYPTSGMNDVNKKSLPASAKLISLTIILFK